jgi:hypothetical protein
MKIISTMLTIMTLGKIVMTAPLTNECFTSVSIQLVNAIYLNSANGKGFNDNTIQQSLDNIRTSCNTS